MNRPVPALLLASALLLSVVVPPSPRPAAAAVEASGHVEARPLKDWRAIADEIAGQGLGIYRARMLLIEDSGELYRKEVRYEAPLPAIDLEGFLDLAPAEQEERRDLARHHLALAGRFERVVGRIREFVQDEALMVNPAGVCESMARFLGALVNATGLDPTDPDAWCDLSFASWAVGDLETHRRAMDAAEAAIRHHPAGMYRAHEHRLALDRAWLRRDRGEFEAGLDRVEEAEALRGPDEESRLLRGLLLAGTGEFTEACRVAAELHEIRVYSPGWGWYASDFAERWIRSTAYRAGGDLALAAFTIGRVRGYIRYPFAHRFFDDVGLLCELNDQLDTARQYYGLAMINRPLMLFFPIESFRGPDRISGLSTACYPYSVAFGDHFVAGSLLSHGAHLVMACEREEDPARRRRLGEAAVEALSACLRRGIRPAVALALRGRAHYGLDDLERAAADLVMACDMLSSQGIDCPDVCSLAGGLEVVQADYGSALPHLSRALKSRPADAFGWNALGVAAVHAGDDSTARRAFDTAIEIAPDSPEGWYNRGLLGFHHARWSEACADLETAVRLAPDFTDAAMLRERACRVRAGTARSAGGAPGPADVRPVVMAAAPDRARAFRFDDAEEIGDAARMYSDQLLGSLANGRRSGEDGQIVLPGEAYRDAIEVLERACAADPSRGNVRDLALAYVRAGEPEKGRALLLPRWDSGIRADEMCVILEADRALGDLSRARGMARLVAREGPDVQDPFVWSLVAFICLDAGLNEEGRAALDAAIELDPGNQALRKQRQFLGGSP